MKKIYNFFIATFAILFILPLTTFAFGFDEAIMLNDQDTLFIGEIIEIGNGEITLLPQDFIMSLYTVSERTNPGGFRPHQAVVPREFLNSNFEVGDRVLASLNNIDGEKFEIAWGMYRINWVNQAGWQVWEVDTGDSLTGAMLSDFVNQDGRFKYSVRNGMVIRHQGDSDIVIYDPNPPEIQPRIADGRELLRVVDGVEHAPLLEEETGINMVYLSLGLAGLAFLALCAWLVYKKSKSNSNI